MKTKYTTLNSRFEVNSIKRQLRSTKQFEFHFKRGLCFDYIERVISKSVGQPVYRKSNNLGRFIMQRSVVLSRKSGIVQTIERPRPTSVAIKTDRSPDSASSNCIVRVEHMQLKRWVETIASEPLFPSDHHEPNHTDCPFPVDPRLNTKIALWTGDLTTLDCDAIVNPTNESFSDNSPFSKRLFVKAGKPLVDHVRRQLQTCRTGDLKLSDGFGLPCRHVLHTVGPKYKPQFHSAAETALFSCYQRVLSSLLDHRWSSIGIPPIHTGT